MQGMVNLFPFYESGGLVLLDVVSKRVGSFNAMTPADWIVSPGRPSGFACNFDGAKFVSAPVADDAPYLGKITIAALARVDTGAAFHHFAGKHTGGGGTQNPFDFRTDNAGTPALFLVRANGGFRGHSGPAVTLGVWKHYCVTTGTLLEDLPTYYVDGVPTAGVHALGSGTGAPTGSGADIRIGRRADGATQLDGAIGLLAIWRRALSGGEVAEWYRNPWQVFPVRRLWINSAAAVAGGRIWKLAGVGGGLVGKAGRLVA